MKHKQLTDTLSNISNADEYFFIRCNDNSYFAEYDFQINNKIIFIIHRKVSVCNGIMAIKHYVNRQPIIFDDITKNRVADGYTQDGCFRYGANMKLNHDDFIYESTSYVPADQIRHIVSSKYAYGVVNVNGFTYLHFTK